MKKELPVSKKINKQRAIADLRQEAQNRLIKDEVMRFRLESANFERLLKYARKINKPVGTLVREWVLERLDQSERKIKESPQTKAINIIANSLAQRGLLKDDQMGIITRLLTEENKFLLR